MRAIGKCIRDNRRYVRILYIPSYIHGKVDSENVGNGLTDRRVDEGGFWEGTSEPYQAIRPSNDSYLQEGFSVAPLLFLTVTHTRNHTRGSFSQRFTGASFPSANVFPLFTRSSTLRNDQRFRSDEQRYRSYRRRIGPLIRMKLSRNGDGDRACFGYSVAQSRASHRSRLEARNFLPSTIQFRDRESVLRAPRCGRRCRFSEEAN